MILDLYFFSFLSWLSNKKYIYLQREPIEIYNPVLQLKYGFIADYKNFYHIAIPFIEKDMNELINLKYNNRRKKYVCITSNKYNRQGYQKRIKMIQQFVKEYPETDIYGKNTMCGPPLETLFGKNYKGEIKSKCKYNILIQYQYCICIENSIHENYFTEKIVDPIMCLTFPIYYGCPNINEYVTDYIPIEHYNTNHIIDEKSLKETQLKVLQEYTFANSIKKIINTIVNESSKHEFQSNDGFHENATNNVTKR